MLMAPAGELSVLSVSSAVQPCHSRSVCVFFSPQRTHLFADYRVQFLFLGADR